MQIIWSGSPASWAGIGCPTWASRGTAFAVIALLVAGGALTPSPVTAQTTPSGRVAGGSDGGSVLDHQIPVMEQALEQAVRRGVQAVERRLPTLAPGLLFFAGAIQARGFALDGYGLFFDIEYPPLRRSILWSMGALNQFNANMAQLALTNAIANVRRQMQTMPEGAGRAALSETLRELESQLRHPPATPVAVGGVGAPAAGSSDGSPLPPVVEPLEVVEIYETALRHALTDTLLTFGRALPSDSVDTHDWLAVAARDGRGLRGSAGDRRTLQLRVQIRDLHAFDAGRISADEVRERVEVR